MKNRGLGRGLSALFSDTEEAYENAAKTDESTGREGMPSEIDVSLIFANPNQPRKAFDETALRELADSISRHGVIMPIVVNKSGDRYMIIAGERRFRASKMAGLSKIPAIVKTYTERQIKEVSLIENLQREDLNPVEAATAIRQLMDDYGLTQEEVADRIGKSRSAVANTLRLLSLSPEVLGLLAQNRLSAGHARALVTLPASAQYAIALNAAENKLSVREVEQKVKEFFNPPEDAKARKARLQEQISIELKDLIERMQRNFGTKVSVIGNDKKGRIYIDYYTRDDLDRLSEIVDLTEKHLKDNE